MTNYYHVGAAKIIGTDRTVMVKSDSGYLSAGYIVEFRIGVHRNLAEVITTSLVNKGSDDEVVLNALSPAYEVEKIYTRYWDKKEEETEDGNYELE